MSQSHFDNKVIAWIDERLPIFSLLQHSTTEYQTPKNLNYWWNFGSLALLMLVIMVLTGVFLVMNYAANTAIAFNSVERIMRDVNWGWLIRYLHMNGASFFFIVVYIHMFRGLYYGSYKAPREIVWVLGMVIYLLMTATAFMGYVLPWGQMSYWGATVITNLFGALPIVGAPILKLLLGGFSVDNPTLNRLFSLHYLLPLVIFALVGLHLWALHTAKSNNPTGVEVKTAEDTIPFHPYYTIKDLFGVSFFLTIYLGFVFFAPNFFGEPDNYIPANSMVTPPHIVPEWYLLPFYAILRSFTQDLWFIPAKLQGVLGMFAAIALLFFLPLLDTSKVRSATFRPIYKQVYWLFVVDVFVLGYVGSQPVSDTLVTIGQLASAYYFFHLLVVLPLLGKFEKTKPLPVSISASVLSASEKA